MCKLSSIQAPWVAEALSLHLKRAMLKFLCLIFLSIPAAWSMDQYSFVVGIKTYKRQGGSSICTGSLIHPYIVLTVAHCLTDIKGAKITIGNNMNDPEQTIWVRDWITHPEYNGDTSLNTSKQSVDVGLIFLDQWIHAPLVFPKLHFFNFSMPLTKIGYGGRNGKNIRTITHPTFSNSNDHYAFLKDDTAVGGDSGGPILQSFDGEISIVALHMGRSVDKDGKLLNYSALQMIAFTNIMAWIDQETLNYSFAIDN